VRPTADRVREALFARLPDLEDWSVLDLYAGTGALGIEALSRGAKRVVFVDRSQPSLTVLRRNLRTLEIEDCTRVVRGDVRGVLPRLARDGESFDLVLADPPYATSEIAGPLALLVSANLLVADATVVVERSRRHPLPRIEGLVLRDSRRYGDTMLDWLERSTEPESGAGQGESNP
jgi:16S rRNA (guanine966-N2)-methyltransferase